MMIMMKSASPLFVLSLVCCNVGVAVMALQGNSYLSQLGSTAVGGTATSVPPFSPPSTSTFFPSPETTVGSGNGMADLYSSVPPGANAGTVRLYQPQSVVASATATTTSNHAVLAELWSNQVSVELTASQLYLSASIWFRTRNFPGMAAWMLDESGEERGHGLAILEFAMKRGDSVLPVTLQPLVAPKNDWQTPVQVWQSILEAEQTNTRNLLRLAAVAHECGEYAATAFLDPFHLEQLDAEDKVGKILSKVQNATPQLLAQLDYELGKQAEEEEGEDH